MADGPDLALLGLAALLFVVPALYLVRAWRIERMNREPLRVVVAVFAVGATASAALALAAELPLRALASAAPAWLFSCLLVPAVEELAKAAALAPGVRHMDEVEDGLVYGLAAGLGFAATENLAFALRLTPQDAVASLEVIALRVVGSTLMHAATTAFVGLALSRALVRRTGRGRIALALACAMALHGAFNALVALPADYRAPGILVAIALAVAAAVVVFVVGRALDDESGPGPQPPVAAAAPARRR